MSDENMDDSSIPASPRYVDETVDADENLRPDVEETKERGTDGDPMVGEHSDNE